MQLACLDEKFSILPKQDRERTWKVQKKLRLQKRIDVEKGIKECVNNDRSMIEQRAVGERVSEKKKNI